MAAVKADNVTKYDAGAQGDNAVDQGYVNSEVEVWADEYEASSLAASSTIDIAELPAGAKVQKVEVYHDDLGTGLTIDVGDSDDADRYIDGADVSSAGKAESNLVNGAQYVIGTASGDSRVQITTLGSTATGTIKTLVWFTR